MKDMTSPCAVKKDRKKDAGFLNPVRLSAYIIVLIIGIVTAFAGFLLFPLLGFVGLVIIGASGGYLYRYMKI